MKWLVFLLVMAGCNTPQSSSQQTENAKLSSAKDSCEDPDVSVDCSFVNMPPGITSVMQISKPGEPGEALTITGRLLHADGITPFANVLMYTYHTNGNGKYTKTGGEKGVQKWHGHLHGWIKTDDSGRYEIRTIRPVSYPNSTIPAHIHPAIKEPSWASYFITDFVFADDPFVNEEYIRSLKRWNYPGDNGIVTLKKENGKWTGTRDIVLLH